MSHKNIGSGISDQILNELIALGTDAKRKNPEIRHACDHSIEIIKPFTGVNGKKHTTQFQTTVKNHPEFIAPWIMACLSKNPKLILQSLKTLSKIIQLQLLPDINEHPKESIDVVEQIVDALYEASPSGEEVQVKLLQLLPSFCQLYAFYINDKILSKVLLICSNLQGANKTPLIVNTAQATFTQLLDIAFSKVDSPNAPPLEQKYDVPIDEQKSIKVDQYLYDVQRIVIDMCTLIEHHKPSYLQTNYISEDYGFEILESLIKNNANIFLSHVELAFLLRTKVAPLLLRFMSSSKDFTLMVKVSRLILLLLNEEFDVLRVESEVTLSLLTHLITKESGSPFWKKILVAEIYVNVFKNKDLLKKIFMEYDNNPKEERKPVIHELLLLLRNLVVEQKHTLNTGDLIQPSSSTQDTASPTANGKQQSKQSHPIGLRTSDFKTVVKYLDCIDKQEPPNVPNTYFLFLISSIIFSLSDCIQLLTLDLMKLTDPMLHLTPEIIESKNDATLKKEFECITDFIVNTWEIQLEISDIFIRSTLDNELFSNNLKLLENLCYCAGIVSLDEVKHSVLKYLGISALRLDGTYGYKSRVQSIGESIVGTISSTLGSAVSNISNNSASVHSSQSNGFKFYPRTINTRQTLVFHTLMRLSVSLGANLKSDWNIVFITLQWISYYVDGPTVHKIKDAPPISQYLQNRDLQIIDHSLGEMTKSIYNLDELAYSDIVKTITQLSEAVLTDSNETPQLLMPLDKNGNLQPCAFNRDFYIGKMADICTINPTKFLISSNSNFEDITKYFCRIVCDRSFTDDMRMLGSRGFNRTLRVCIDTGFDNNDENSRKLTEVKVLTSMFTFLEQLSGLPFSDELLIVNCEAGMVLQTLETLKALIDRHGSKIQQMWSTVTDILNIPFQLIQTASAEQLKEKALNEMITSILKSSFETIKVILDEILHCIPKTQIKVIIDSLYNFVSQTFDLNISFNSVSYFWLISDYIKDKLEAANEAGDFYSLSLSESDLISVLEKCNDTDNQYYQYLWIYLVLKLAKTAPDSRVQVRNGSILTTFSVIDSFSYNDELLSLLYDIVLFPHLLQMKVPANLKSLKSTDQKDWMDSYMNITSGIFKVFLIQINSVFNIEQVTKMWEGIVTFMVDLVNLDFGWIELNTLLFKSYSEVLSSFLDSKQELSSQILELSYSPWSSIKLNYNFNNASQYQAMLCSFVGCFKKAFDLLKPEMNVTKFEKMLTVLNFSIKYPVLVDTRNDYQKCTILQKTVLENLEKLEIDKSDSHYISYESLIFQQLNVIITLPFHTRDLIIKKIGDKDIKVPSFVAASNYGIKILEIHLSELLSLPFINDGSIMNTIRSLIEPTRLKNSKMKISNDDNEEVSYLWMISFNCLTKIVEGVIDLLISTLKERFTEDLNKKALDALIPYLVSSFECCFVSYKENTEEFDLHQYYVLKTSLTKLFQTFDKGDVYEISDDVIESFISLLWTNSFFYKHDSIMESVIPIDLNVANMKELTATLCHETNWDIFGTTERITIAPRLHLSQQCLVDLTELSKEEKFPSLGKVGYPFLIARCAYTFRKFIMDKKLVGEQPPMSIQVVDLQNIVQCLQSILQISTEPVSFTINQHKLSAYLKELTIYTLPLVADENVRKNLTKVCCCLCK
ncbi:hypothetical protein CANINC_002836 [Pichia inconspicua]|uniref:Uncharacterized protein n=1 Tax=Pichia inconspicua TaxID=52247 RepID=A0A4T0X042_9ASCO|nr:hypothetical protein CANINC_002836 [[Candida] inconspicua]